MEGMESSEYGPYTSFLLGQKLYVVIIKPLLLEKSKGFS